MWPVSRLTFSLCTCKCMPACVCVHCVWAEFHGGQETASNWSVDSQIRITISAELNAISPATFVRFRFINFSEKVLTKEVDRDATQVLSVIRKISPAVALIWLAFSYCCSLINGAGATDTSVPITMQIDGKMVPANTAFRCRQSRHRQELLETCLFSLFHRYVTLLTLLHLNLSFKGADVSFSFDDFMGTMGFVYAVTLNYIWPLSPLPISSCINGIGLSRWLDGFEGCLEYFTY